MSRGEEQKEDDLLAFCCVEEDFASAFLVSLKKGSESEVFIAKKREKTAFSDLRFQPAAAISAPQQLFQQ